MRVIAGRLGGRLFDSPHNNRTHPMSDKMRGALFNILGDIAGLTVLDPFAGTGALSFEAISRGAASATAVEIDPSAQAVIVQNIHALDLGKEVRLAKGTATAWLRANQQAQFDLILCDPPYKDVQEPLLVRLTRALKVGGIYVVSWPGHFEPADFPGLLQVEQRSYGDAQLVFYRKL